MRIVLLLFLLPFLAARAEAQEGHGSLVEGRVIAVANGSVEIDRGLVDGLRTGDSVTLLVPGGSPLSGRVLTVSQRSATVQVGSGAIVEMGVPVEVRIPGGRSTPGDTPRSDTPEHPPWENPVQDWPKDKPLLAPVSEITPADRSVLVSGRIYAFADMVWDDERDTSSSFSRGGIDLRVQNAFGLGGRLRFDGEGNASDFTSADGLSDESESNMRIDRLSYAIGGDRHNPLRVEAGRFLQHGMPQFGVLDGAEVGFRLPNGHRFGGSFGYIPLLYGSNAGTGEDMQTSVFYRIHSADDQSRLGAGYQKTWHDGTPDRDLLLIEGSSRSDGGLRVFGSAWVDLYDANDPSRDGTELTRVMLNAYWRDRQGNGWSAGVSQFRFPSLAAQQTFDPTALVYTDKEVRRGDLSLFRDLGNRTTGTAKVHFWSDEDASGGGGELRWDARDLWLDRTRVGAAVFLSQARFSDVFGGRLDGSYYTKAGQLRLALHSANYANAEFTTGSSDLLQHRIRLSYDVAFDGGWSLSAYGEMRSGDEQSSRTAGFYLQKTL